MSDVLNERIERRITELEQAREELLRQIVAYNAAIGELRSLLDDDEAEEATTEP